MGSDDGFDRYNWKHRSDSEYGVGESMPGTVGDSDGTHQERLGEQPVVDEDVVAFEPGATARQNEQEAKQARQDQRVTAPDDIAGETTAIELTEKVDGGAIGHHEGHRVFVPDCSSGETVLVNLALQDDTLVGERVRLRE